MWKRRGGNRQGGHGLTYGPGNRGRRPPLGLEPLEARQLLSTTPGLLAPDVPAPSFAGGAELGQPLVATDVTIDRGKIGQKSNDPRADSLGEPLFGLFEFYVEHGELPPDRPDADFLRVCGGRVAIEVTSSVPPTQVASAIESLGGTVTYIEESGVSLSAWLPIPALDDLTAIPGFSRARPTFFAIVHPHPVMTHVSDVSAVVDDQGNLIIEGDDRNNAVSIVVKPDGIIVGGTFGTTINGDYQAAVFKDVRGDVRILLHGGDDYVNGGGSFQGIVWDYSGVRPLGRYASVATSPVAGNLIIDTGTGEDELRIESARFLVGGDVRVHLGDGADRLRFQNADIGGDVRVDGGDGDDHVMLSDLAIEGSLIIRTSSGDDRVGLAEPIVIPDLEPIWPTLVVGHDVDVDLGTGNDEASVYRVTCTGRMLILAGADHDAVAFGPGAGTGDNLGDASAEEDDPGPDLVQTLGVDTGSGDDLLPAGPLLDPGDAILGTGQGADAVPIGVSNIEGSLPGDVRGGDVLLIAAHVEVGDNARVYLDRGAEPIGGVERAVRDTFRLQGRKTTEISPAALDLLFAENKLSRDFYSGDAGVEAFNALVHRSQPLETGFGLRARRSATADGEDTDHVVIERSAFGEELEVDPCGSGWLRPRVRVRT